MSYVNKMRDAGKKSDFFPFTAYVEEVEAARIAYDADAEIAALTERLRIVEAERDGLKEKALRWYRADGTYETCANEADVIERRKAAAVTLASISALRAELQRKDAALKEAWLVLNVCEGELSAISHRGTVDANNVKNFSAEARAAILRIENALQPKEPPCQTA